MKVSSLLLKTLSDADRTAWADFRQQDPLLASPYFSLAYLEAVEKARPGIDILRFTEGDTVIGFLPIRKGWFGTTRPVAGPMDDLHGVIAAPSAVIDLHAPDIAPHLSGYTFSAVPFNQRRHGLHGSASEGNQVLDLSNGFDAYIDARAAFSSNFRRTWRKVGRLLQDKRTVTRHQINDPASFTRLIDLKRTAFETAGYFDLFTLDWPLDLLETLAASSNPDAQGILSKLEIDGELAAVCFCMRSEHVLHYWFPAYEAKFQSHKAGLALLFSLADWAASQGLQEMHLGLGNTQYKRLMASYRVPVRQGALAIGPAQKVGTRFTRWGAGIEPKGGLRSLPSKLARKYERVALAGKLSA
ncbi:MAG: GNAT family N-acetyltransferase [Henriciella sp.]|nr:GNAT family N-acetyltransferase [Henriciella sp.]